jgi:hypothetical protein
VTATGRRDALDEARAAIAEWLECRPTPSTLMCPEMPRYDDRQMTALAYVALEPPAVGAARVSQWL